MTKSRARQVKAIVARREKHTKYLMDLMAIAYEQHTKCQPDDVELVIDQIGERKIYTFQKKGTAGRKLIEETKLLFSLGMDLVSAHQDKQEDKVNETIKELEKWYARYEKAEDASEEQKAPASVNTTDDVVGSSAVAATGV